MTNKSDYNAEALEFLLIKVCDDLENAKISFEIPKYLEDFWKSRRGNYYDGIEKEKRRQQYLKLKEEFGPESENEYAGLIIKGISTYCP